MSNTVDVIIIGGGHNGLVTAAYLARAGLSVTVLERRERVGGASVTEEVWPGCAACFSRGSYASLS
jgi:phytoene dehydrogenase-like protein